MATASAPPILCVHTSDRPDRRANVDVQARRFDLPVEVVTFSKDERDPVRGCCASHLRVLRLSRERCYDAVMVLENDVDFMSDPRPWASGPKKLPWDVCYLGGTLSRVVLTAPVVMTDATFVAVLELAAREPFEDVDARIAGLTAEVVVILPATEAPEDDVRTRVARAFGEVASSNANAFVDPMDGGRALRFAAATYESARVVACLRGEGIVGPAIMWAVLERLMEVTHCEVRCDVLASGPSSIALERRAWLPATVLSTHCYVLAGACLDGFIAALEANLDSDTVEPVDVVYRRLSVSRDVYMLREPVALQVPSYSDVEREQTDYRKVQAYTLPEYPVNHERRSIRRATVRDDGLTLALAEVDPLPRVSVLTITRHRRRRFALAVNNF
jgi:hypothetical protein